MANKKSILVIVLLAAALVVAGAAVFFLWEREPEGLVVGISSLPDSLNPVLPQNTQGLNADELLYDGLVNFEVDQASGQRSAELALAESITQDPATKKGYDVVLKDTKWHDGTPLTASDVEYSFAAYMDPENESPQRGYLGSFLESVKAVDAKTLRIEFRKPIPEFRAFPILTFKIIPSLYKKARLSTNLRATQAERDFSTAPIGTGPYMLKTWEIGKWLTFDANPTYFRMKPVTGSLVLRLIRDRVQQKFEFTKAKVNLLIETSPLDRTELEKGGKVQISSFLPYAYYQVAINTKSALFTKPEARYALWAATDRKALVAGITDRDDLTQVNDGPFPANLFARNFSEYNVAPFADPHPTDVAAATKLADASGLGGKTVVLLFRDSLGDFGQKMADSLVAQYAKVGLTVEAKRTGDQVFDRLVFAEKNFDLALIYADGFDNVYSDTSNWYRAKGSKNIYGISDPALEDLFDAWDSTVVAADWINLTRKIHDRVGILAPAIPLVSVQKDVYSRAINHVVIASDNPFLSVEEWAQVK
jgi:peptide/nickel transport system substrate-binding protein